MRMAIFRVFSNNSAADSLSSEQRIQQLNGKIQPLKTHIEKMQAALEGATYDIYRNQNILNHLEKLEIKGEALSKKQTDQRTACISANLKLNNVIKESKIKQKLADGMVKLRNLIKERNTLLRAQEQNPQQVAEPAETEANLNELTSQMQGMQFGG